MTKGRIVRWILLTLLLVAILWSALSNRPFAQGIREVFGSKPDQTILDKSFVVPAHSFRYYSFSLPLDSKNVEIVGQFSGSANDAGQSEASRVSKDQAANGTIEVLVLGEVQFAEWQRGTAVNPVYDSGQVSHGKLQRDLPRGAGAYYILVSNKIDATRAKKVNATLRLHYKSWFSR